MFESHRSTTLVFVASKLTRDMSLSNRKNEPAHYRLKIESFSVLSEAGIDKIESEIFEASGYKWRLNLYPNGYKGTEGNYISLYLIICDTESFPKGWKVQVDVHFFVYNHKFRHYVKYSKHDYGIMSRFDEWDTQWGCGQLISLEHFMDSSKGYLFNDSCVFGVEVFAVPKYTQNDRCLSMIKPPSTMNSYSWTIHKFSAVKEEELISQVFKVGKVKWYISLFPKGTETGAGRHLSLYLGVDKDALPPADWRVYAKYELRVKSQGARHIDKKRGYEVWFSNSALAWGHPRFVALSKLCDKTKGFLLNDRLIVEAKISVVGIQKNIL